MSPLRFSLSDRRGRFTELFEEQHTERQIDRSRLGSPRNAESDPALPNGEASPASEGTPLDAHSATRVPAPLEKADHVASGLGDPGSGQELRYHECLSHSSLAHRLGRLEVSNSEARSYPLPLGCEDSQLHSGQLLVGRAEDEPQNL